MARALRIEYPGAIYHVTCRGNERSSIVVDDHDRRSWIDYIKRVVHRYELLIYAYILLDNHYHIFLKTLRGELSRVMHDLNGGYTTWYNRRHIRSGNLFSGRYKAILVEGEAHYLELSRYIHLNPVRAGIVSRPEHYRWSSYPGYHWKSKAVDWVAYEEVLARFGDERRRERYRQFVRAGMEMPVESPLSKVVGGLLLGSEQFVEKMKSILGRREPSRDLPQLRKLAERPEFHRIVDSLVRCWGLDLSEVLVRGRHGNEPRKIAVYLAREVWGVPVWEVAKGIGKLSPSVVSDITKEISDRAKKSLAFARRLEEAEALVRMEIESEKNRKT